MVCLILQCLELIQNAQRYYEEQGWTGMYTLVVPTLSVKLKITTRMCQFSQYLRTKPDMLFEIAKSVEIVTIF